MTRALAVLVAGTLAVAGLVIAGAAQPAPMTWKVAIGGETPDHGVQAQIFAPGTITVHAGDTVTWTMAALFEHTVTFLSGTRPPDLVIPEKGGKFLFPPTVVLPQGEKTYGGAGMASSGVLHAKESYSLTFTKPGRYSYVCVLHPGMAGAVNVRPRGAELARDQAAYDEVGAQEVASELKQGQAARASARVSVSGATTGTTYTSPMVASVSRHASVVRFNPEMITVKTGDTVRWVMNDPLELHTVTFSGSEQPADFLVPEPQPQGPPKIYYNAKALVPLGGPTHAGNGYYNSGFMFLGPRGVKSYSLTFTRPGTYTYWCVVHVPQGMKGTVVVQ